MKVYHRRRISVILHYLSVVFMAGGALLCLPFAVGLLYGDALPPLKLAQAFLLPGMAAALLGGVIRFFTREYTLSLKDSMAVCTLSWVMLSAMGAIPFTVILNASYLDAYFETMSGFTTTGITVLNGLDAMPRAILFWRALIQWVGGLGILSMFILLGLKGGAAANKLFMAEGHKIAGKQPSPALFRTARILWLLYIVFTLMEFLTLLLLKLDVFDALTHAFTTLSTGGYSIYDQSIAHYRAQGVPHAHLIESVMLLFMVIGGMNFFVHYRVMTGQIRALWDSTEVRYYWIIVLSVTGLILIETLRAGQWQLPQGLQPVIAIKAVLIHLKDIAFQVVSVITTTGYATRDINEAFFPALAKQLFLLLMVVGGCAGSTGGGFKVIRVAILMRLVRTRLFKLNANRQVRAPLTIDGQRVEDDELERIFVIFFLWILLLLLGGGITALFSDLSAWQSYSGMFSALGNIGPCYFSVADMMALSPVVKITYIVGMLAGRLEILPVVMLLSRRYFK